MTEPRRLVVVRDDAQLEGKSDALTEIFHRATLQAPRYALRSKLLTAKNLDGV